MTAVNVHVSAIGATWCHCRYEAGHAVLHKRHALSINYTLGGLTASEKGVFIFHYQ